MICYFVDFICAHVCVCISCVYFFFFPLNSVLFVCLPICLLKRKRQGMELGGWGVERIWEQLMGGVNLDQKKLCGIFFSKIKNEFGLEL